MKIQGPRFQINYIIARYWKSDLHGTSFLRKTCMSSITQQFLVSVSMVSPRNAWHNGLLFVTPKTDQKFRGVLPEKLGGVCSALPKTLTLFQTKICDFPYSISGLIKNLIPYFRPEALEPGAWPERMTSCYGTYAVVGINIKGKWSYRQMMKK